MLGADLVDRLSQERRHLTLATVDSLGEVHEFTAWLGKHGSTTPIDMKLAPLPEDHSSPAVIEVSWSGGLDVESASAEARKRNLLDPRG